MFVAFFMRLLHGMLLMLRAEYFVVKRDYNIERPSLKDGLSIWWIFNKCLFILQ